MQAQKTLWNGYRGLAARTTADYANFTGTKFLWLANQGDVVQLNPVVREVTEKYGVPHIEKAIGRPVAERLYDQSVVNPPDGWDFVPLMYRRDIVPESLRSVPKYRRAIALVEEFYTKNGFVSYCLSRGLGQLIPPTVIVHDGRPVSDLPYEKSWIKRDIEQKLAGVKSVTLLEASDRQWKRKLTEFLSQDSGTPYQIQMHRGDGAARLMSPCLTFSESGYEMLFASDPVIEDDHSSGSQIPGRNTESVERFANELYQSLHEDGYLGALNTDVIWNPTSGHSMIEYNMRFGGSHIPWAIMKSLGHANAYYERECPVSSQLNTADVFAIIEKHGVYAFRWGDMAQPEASRRHIGLVGIGDNARATLHLAKAELSNSNR